MVQEDPKKDLHFKINLKANSFQNNNLKYLLLYNIYLKIFSCSRYGYNPYHN